MYTTYCCTRENIFICNKITFRNFNESQNDLIEMPGLETNGFEYRFSSVVVFPKRD